MLRTGLVLMISSVLLPFASTSVHAQDRLPDMATGEAGPVARLYECRAIADDNERLACFDREVAALQLAESNKDVVIADREQLREARRGLFGFSLPKIRLFGGGDDDEGEVEEIKEIEEALTAFGMTSTGKAIFTIASGAQWVQTDSVPVLGEPEVGDMVKIEQAALGSYKAKIDDRRAIRVRRVE